jgi:hypothetical protein
VITFSNDVCLLGRLETIIFPYLCLSACATVLYQEKAICTCIHACNQLSFCLDMVANLSNSNGICFQNPRDAVFDIGGFLHSAIVRRYDISDEGPVPNSCSADHLQTVLSSTRIIASFWASIFGMPMGIISAELTLQTNKLHHWVHYHTRK